MTKILLLFKIWKEKRKRLKDWKNEKRIKWLAEGVSPGEIEQRLKVHKILLWQLIKKVFN